jgi:hypothetical protein
MDRNNVPLEPHHLVVPSDASKMISKPMVHLVQTMHLSCTDTNTVSKQKEERFHKTHVTSEFHRVRPKWFSSLWYIRRKACTSLANISKWTELLLKPRHLGVPSGVSKMISELVVCLAQTMHLSCTDTNTVSKQKEVRFHMTHIT